MGNKRVGNLLRLWLILSTIGLVLSACSNGVRTVQTSTPAGEPSPSPVISKPADIVQVIQTLAPTSPNTQQASTAANPATCTLTPPDMLGPFYKPGAPVRDKVGEGYTLTGVVRSGNDCSPIAGVQIEFWLAGPQGEYGDAWRATTFSAEDGTYRFESNFPPSYLGRPPHIHVKVSAEGYQELVTQYYPAQGTSQAEFDLVLAPAS